MCVYVLTSICMCVCVCRCPTSANTVCPSFTYFIKATMANYIYGGPSFILCIYIHINIHIYIYRTIVPSGAFRSGDLGDLVRAVQR